MDANVLGYLFNLFSTALKAECFLHVKVRPTVSVEKKKQKNLKITRRRCCDKNFGINLFFCGEVCREFGSEDRCI